MKTSCYKCYKGKSNGVGISLSAPSFWNGPDYPKLAPSSHLLYAIKSGTIDEIEYEKRFRKEVLAKLDPMKVYEDLKDNVLLCWEPAGEFCHRRIVAAWIHENLGVEVPEWKREDDIIIDKHTPLF